MTESTPKPGPFDTTYKKVYWLVCAMLLVVLISMVNTIVQQWTEANEPARPTVKTSGTMAYNNTKPANDGEACCGDGKSQTGDQIVASLFNQRSATSMLKEQIGGEPMTTEPIGLLAYANGVRESGIRRTADGQVEEIVFWEFADAEMNAVLAHYDAQVSKAGFKATKSNKPTTQSESIHRIYYMNKPDTSHVDQVLTIRLGPVQRNASKGVRTMIWLRYPAATK